MWEVAWCFRLCCSHSVHFPPVPATGTVPKASLFYKPPRCFPHTTDALTEFVNGDSDWINAVMGKTYILPSSEDEQWLADALSDCRRRPPTQSGEEFVSFTVNRLIFEQINAACEANINNMQTLLGLIGRDQTE
eukprot:Opistho-1_new@77396